MQRQSVVAGQFYSDNPAELRRHVESFLAGGAVASSGLESREVMGLMAPHAGYIYSGAIAGETFAAAEVPDSVILLGPNHRGIGHPRALYSQGSWITPLGAVAIDENLAQLILAADPAIDTDISAHQYEHSLEVILPFLQLCNPQVKIVPLSLSTLPFSDLEQMAQHLSGVIKNYPKKVLIVASSDMTHYEAANVARKKDMYALEALLQLDAKQLYQRVQSQQISMCGVTAVVLMLLTLSACGAQHTELIRYGNSGEVSGDMNEVVGYAGAVIS